MTDIADDLTRILLEVVADARPAKPDTPEMAAKREKYRIGVEAIKAKGGVVDIPQELP